MDEGIPITAEEEKQLRRVFELLCDYAFKKKLEDEINAMRITVKLKPVCVPYLTTITSLSAWHSSIVTSSSIPYSEAEQVI